MYNVKGPSKIVAKTTRRGISQNIETFRDYSRNKSVELDDNDFVNGPKPIFHNNAKRTVHNQQRQEEVITPQHEEIIKFINESWNLVYSEIEQSSVLSDGSVSPRSDHSITYYEDDPSPMLQDFKPFDLESWWGKRLFTYITSSVNSKC